MTLDQLREFLAGTQPVAFSVSGDKDDRYRWIQRELTRFHYLTLPRADKGVVMRYLVRITGYSRQQLTRLIAQYRETGCLQRDQLTAGFARRHTDQDIRLLAAMDVRHETPCGPAVKKLGEHACVVFGQTEYRTLPGISVSQLYNLRKSPPLHWAMASLREDPSYGVDHRRTTQAPTLGKAGLHPYRHGPSRQSGQAEGGYHINAFDEATQWGVVCTVEKISGRFLLPALEQMFEACPFVLLGFYSDNGSEYINKRVAVMLEKLRIEFTKSRSRQSNDNALAEGKNAAIVRKQFGYGHIAQRWTSLIDTCNQKHLNPNINFHRPCFFPKPGSMPGARSARCTAMRT